MTGLCGGVRTLANFVIMEAPGIEPGSRIALRIGLYVCSLTFGKAPIPRDSLVQGTPYRSFPSVSGLSRRQPIVIHGWDALALDGKALSGLYKPLSGKSNLALTEVGVDNIVVVSWLFSRLFTRPTD